MNTAVDTNSNGRYWPQYDPDRSRTPLEALDDGEEWAMDQFADWLADEQPKELRDLLSYLERDPVVRSLARRWADQA